MKEIPKQAGVVVEFPASAKEVSCSPEKPLAILLQGPVGPFFQVFTSILESSGYDVLKVNFNGGDWLFSRGSGVLNFSGSLDDWSAWLEPFLRRRRPEIIALFGDSRPYHRQAISVAERVGVGVICFEEGYVRPDFITCEWNGNNARSPLYGQALGSAAGKAADAIQPIKANLFRSMAKFAVGYYLAATAGAIFFRGNLHHRKRGLCSEAVFWARSLYRKLWYYPANSQLMLDLIENCESRYFVVALQVHDDQQLLRHGRGWTMERLITESILSFKQHAEAQHHLVIKVHPMDRGHKSYRPFVRELARLAGCSDRIHVVDDGSIGLLIRHSLGLVTVNSTSGLLALNHGKPLVALGDALYNYPELLPADGLSGRGALDRFWHSNHVTAAQSVQAFNALMRKSSLVNGSFYIRGLMEETCRRVMQHLENERPSILKTDPVTLKSTPPRHVAKAGRRSLPRADEAEHQP